MQRHKGLERLLEKSGVFGDVRGNLLPLAYDGAGRLCVAAATLPYCPWLSVAHSRLINAPFPF